MPWWLLSSKPGWKDPERDLGKAGGNQRRKWWWSKGNSPSTFLPSALPTTGVGYPSSPPHGPETTWIGCLAPRTAATPPARLMQDGLCCSSWWGGAVAIEHGYRWDCARPTLPSTSLESLPWKAASLWQSIIHQGRGGSSVRRRTRVCDTSPHCQGRYGGRGSA